ncbi:ead/Ea22-like family protein [Raoultella ornithinolytica]|uniref:ead/Ea22-like family protein n=1 Tax=Raoultella planticola TaxID=575 RepID=UPI00292C1A65|nr:ead/Ea22-like family protein [Raoultella ornithinolytica]EKW7116229.1 ead/Ea22-like family protein [Raoultella ornithinolytica]ELS0866510.1 ead/Ea22-like family protein [Raoultella ornithinolytica]MDV1189261.1 ead/Ea22-like family protein [Raoultella planticola]
MTTDITELAQSLKAAAEKATPGPWGVARDSKTLVSNQSHPIATVSDAMHRMLADGSTGKDAEFIALANPANIRALVEALEKAQQRIAELESRTVKLPKFKMLEDYLAEVAIEERKQILVGVKLEFHRACAAAGIKVEAE